MPTGPWSFRDRNDVMGLLPDPHLACPYGGWTIWIRPDVVQAFELLVRVGINKQAIKLLE
jgi:hypothetical protein